MEQSSLAVGGDVAFSAMMLAGAFLLAGAPPNCVNTTCYPEIYEYYSSTLVPCKEGPFGKCDASCPCKEVELYSEWFPAQYRVVTCACGGAEENLPPCYGQFRIDMLGGTPIVFVSSFLGCYSPEDCWQDALCVNVGSQAQPLCHCSEGS